LKRWKKRFWARDKCGGRSQEVGRELEKPNEKKRALAGSVLVLGPKKILKRGRKFAREAFEDVSLEG